jgi:hypothetical protein
MSDFGASVLINVPAEEVFDFASKPEHMPYYLEAVYFAEPLGDGRIRIIGSIKGHDFEAEGWFDVDQHHLMMRWGTDGKVSYVGHLTVTPMDAFTSKAEVHLICSGAARQGMQDALDRTMANIKQICEDNSMKIPAELQLGNKRYMG